MINRPVVASTAVPSSKYHRYVSSNEAQRRFAEDARLLKEIGAVLATQNTRIRLRLPTDLARHAVESWNWDDGGGILGPESPEEKTARERSGDLALIGLSIEERGVPGETEVEVEIEAMQVAAALEAHYEN